MKQKVIDKKIMTIYLNTSKSPPIKNKKIEFKNKTNNYLIAKYELIHKILNQKMNLICFDCRKKTPKYISINNAIFLCTTCALIHKKNLPEKISFIIDNNLNLLSINYLRYLFIGGNQNLDNFINFVYPGLQNYPPKILYRTQALNYYRENLKYKIDGGHEPICPNELMAYKIVSENGLINIRDKTNLYHDLNLSLDNSEMNSNFLNSNNDIINNYFNNYNNTYNTYNSISITNETQESPNKNNNTINTNVTTMGTSLSNKAFFNEMKNLFSKRYIRAYKHNYDTYRKLTPIKSFDDLSKVKYNKYNNKNEYINKPLTNRLNESLNYSFATLNKNSLKNIKLNNNNKSSISFIANKSPRNIDNNLSSSHRYTKPNIKNIKINYGISMKYIENGKLKKIYNNKNKFNNQLQQKNVLKFFKIQKKTKSFFKSKDNNNISNTSINNSKIDINKDNNLSDKIFYKEKLINKINKNKANNLFIDHNLDYLNKSNDIPIKNNKITENNLFKNNNNIACYNNKNKNKKNKIPIGKINKINISFDGYKKLKPIKVNLRMNFDKKKQALKDKKEQEKLEQEALHNIRFESHNKNDNDIFTNIIYLNRTNI